VPDVVQLDGIWFSLMVPTGKRKRDRLYERGLTGERGLRLIVHDGNGGVTSALSYGYFDVLEQRCIFHKIQNVADGFRKDGGGSVEEITNLHYSRDAGAGVTRVVWDSFGWFNGAQ
jgi:hypothetical protein